MKIKELFDLNFTVAAEYLKGYVYPWEALAGLKEFIFYVCGNLDAGDYEEMSPYVWVHKSAKVARSAFLGAPCIVGAGTEIRSCAFIRGSAVIGNGCVVGNSTEIKNAVLFDRVQVPHYNYVGDSILGFKAHLGAGAVTSNVKSDRTPITVRGDGYAIATGLKKLGAMIGDGVEVGCNSVLNPGTVIGKNTNIYPLSCVRGFIPADSIYKESGTVIKKIN